MVTPNKHYIRFAVGTRCGDIQIWTYDNDGIPNVLLSVKIGATIPRKVAFGYDDDFVRVFGFYDGFMYVHNTHRKGSDEIWIRHTVDIETGKVLETISYHEIV